MEPFRAQLLESRVGLLQAGQAHPSEHLGRFRELDVGVRDHLELVAPGVDERVAADLQAGLRRGVYDPLHVVDHETEVAMAIGWVRRPRGKGDELIAEVDEGHPPGTSSQLEVEDPPVELERLLDVADLERHVVDAECPRHGVYLDAVDTFLAIASRREVRDYAGRPIPGEVERRILDAGRLSGNSQNRQNWRFLVLEDEGLRRRVADGVYAPSNIHGAALVVAIVVFGKGPTSFDAGRAAQNMLLAAWNDGVGASPNGIKDADDTARLLGLEEGERPAIILSFGYPARPRDPETRTAEEWSARANRKPLDEVVRRL